MASDKYVQDGVEIMSVGYKIAHGLNIVLFTILAITGSILLFPDLMQILAYVIGAPLASLLGTPPASMGAELARTSHRFIGVLWGVFLAVYGLYLAAFRRAVVFRPLLKPFSQQVREAKALLAHYIAGKPMPQDVEERLDRHNVLVAYMALLLLAGLLLLSISGVLLMFSDMFTVGTVRLMLFLHDLGFYLSVIFLLAHLFATLHPSNRPLLLAMFGYGRVPLEWARRHMGRYVQRGVS
ncbi:MAG: cytochrome b/b6 domain-containing protein [Pyrobaculum sp.]